MSHKSSFFNAVESGGVYDRTYNASDFAEFFAQFIGNGVYANPSSGLQVRASSGMQITINPGYAWINGYMFSVLANTTDSLTLTTADASYGRIDSIVVGLNLTNREITPYVRTGSPSSSPAPVSLVRTSTVYEIELAQILVPAGAASITQSNITDVRSDTARCGWVTGLVDQIDTSDLFIQFTAAFNEWFEDFQNTIDDDTAANLLLRIQAIESNNGKIYYTTYSGSGSFSKSIQLPFAPVRVVITARSVVNGIATKSELEICTADQDSYVGVYTRQNSNLNNMVESLNISKTMTGSTVTLSWTSGSSSSSCNESGKTYYVTAWGVQ